MSTIEIKKPQLLQRCLNGENLEVKERFSLVKEMVNSGISNTAIKQVLKHLPDYNGIITEKQLRLLRSM